MIRSSLAFALLCVSISCSSAAPPPRSGEWSRVQKLIDEQKLEEASKLVAQIRAEAKRTKNGPDWTESLIKEVQLRTALGGFETAVKFLVEEPWPDDALSQTALELFKAQSLVTYLRAYGWEISQREKVESKGPVDLKAWTKDQIFAEAERAYTAAWQRRAQLGKEKVAALAQYVQPNNYPERIRGTLRDAVSYLFVDLLANTSDWTPEQSNEAYRLDAARLIAGDAKASSAVKLDDPAVHPLVKIGAILDDLEAWHEGAGQREAALEARLERARRLQQQFSGKAERALVRHDLETRLPQLRSVEWWSMGMGELAQLVQAEGDLVQAHALALDGEKASPQSPGGQRCRSIARAIEAPDFSIASMSSDGPRKRSVEVTARNLPALHFRAYPVDLVKRITTARDYNLLPSGDELRKLLSSQAAASWSEKLPATPDFKSHRTFVTPPLDGPGLFMIVASADAQFRSKPNRVVGVALIVGDPVLAVRQDGTGGVYAQVVSGATGKPLAGVDVELYRYDWNRGHHKVDGKRTDDNGEVRFTGRDDGGGHFLLARRGREIALDQSWLGLYRTSENPARTGTLVYTDRSIYRPLQKLLWKVVGYSLDPRADKYQTLPGRKMDVQLVDPNGQVVVTKSVTTNAYGSAAGEFAIPTGRLLGHWTVRTSDGSGASTVRVEEYKRPTFEVALLDSDTALRLNKPATLTGEAKYYFGLPVASGNVKWRVQREPVYPYWWGWWYGGERVQSQTIATGSSPLASDGKFKISFTPEADEKAEGAASISYRYQVSADLTDEGGETRSAERGFRLGFVSVEASITPPAGFLRAGGSREVAIARTNLDGAPRPGKGRWRLVALKQPAQAQMPSEEPLPSAKGLQTPGDKLRARFVEQYSPEGTMARWDDGAEQAHGELTHDAQGNAKLTLPELAPGAYRIRYETLDDFGAKAESWKDLLVAAPSGKRTPLALPLELELETGAVEVGEAARFFVSSGIDGELIFEIWRDGKRSERRRLDAAKSSLVEIPVGKNDRGGFSVSVTAVRDHQSITFERSISVPFTDHALALEWSTFRDKIRPGAKESWRVTVKSQGGGHVDEGVAEILAYMYDRSLDLFAPHSPPSPMSLFPSRTGVPSGHDSLGRADAQWVYNENFADVPGGPSLYGDRLIFFDSYGIGGMGGRRRHALMRGGSGGPMAEAAPMATPAAPSGAVMARAPAKKAKSAGDDRDADGIPDQADKAEEEKPREQQAQAGATPVRSNFSETAFFRPQLLTDKSGAATIEFTVPDSVTSWNVWVHAITKDLRSGALTKQTRSVKDLMVRPYLPRFFREGDQAALKVVVNNASDHPISGEVDFDILDGDAKVSKAALFSVGKRTQPFTVPPGGGTNLTFPVTAPKQVGTFAFRVTAKSKEFSDGEQRPLPVLPGRMHLIQSRFVTLRDKDKREMTFADLAKNDDPSRVNDQMVITLDTQLFFTVLKALPYLVQYPYECSEQTLNRFVSTGIVSSLYSQYPAVGKMAKAFAQRKTQIEPWDANDPNRKMTLEETPWLEVSKGNDDLPLPLLNVLDPQIARAQRDSALEKLKKAQTSLGAFPWFPGGPPSPWMTLYIMYGFAKASEFKVEVPKDVVLRAWQYLARHYREEYVNEMRKNRASAEFLTFLGYVASSYPDDSWTGNALTADERKEMLAYSFKHWKSHSPYLKGLLSMTLKRAGRGKDAQLVFASVMDSAKTAKDQGTFWQPEDRSWLWYNDTIESHAFALRALMEIDPANQKLDGLVLWLLLNKKMNQWKSTRATAEVIYSLTKYMQKNGSLGVREDATVSVGDRKQTFVFEPDQYVGKTQIVIPGSEVDAKSSTVKVEKSSKGVAFASATWHFSTEKLPDEARGDFFSVTRSYFRRVPGSGGFTLQPLAEGAQLEPGDELEVHLSLRSKHQAEYVHLRDPRAAGLEPENAVSRYKWDLGIGWYEEVRDSGTNFFFEALPAGEYTFKYRVRANLAGTFRVGPATVQSMYAPEFAAYSAGNVLTIRPQK